MNSSEKAVEQVQAQGKMCILDIDVQGVKQIKQTSLCPRLIFVKPPTLDDLKNRLLNRGTETDESLKKRLSVAQAELEYGKKFRIFKIKNLQYIPACNISRF